MTLVQIAELIAERKGRQFDVPFNLEMQDAVVYHRARYVSNRLQKNPALKSYYMQSAIVDLIEVGRDECAEAAECSCENILVSDRAIPRPLVVGVHPFEYVGSPSGVQAFGWTTFGSENFLSKSPITGKRQRHTYLNSKLYVFNDKNLDRIRFEGVFADPRLLSTFKCGTDTSIMCYSASLDFPLDDDLIQVIVEQILRVELREPIEEQQEIKADKNV